MICLLQTQRKPGSYRFILWLVAILGMLIPASAEAQLAITTTALPAGNTSNNYSTTLAASGGTSPYTWSLLNGTLPPGLTISPAGVISGVPTTVTPGTPPVPTQFTVQVTDAAANTATQAFGIVILAPGSHSLVISQIFTGGNAGTSSNPSPYKSDYVEIFNAGPVAVDLQNWTLQYGSSSGSVSGGKNNYSSSFANSGVVPIGSLDPYKIGTTGGPNNNGNFPAFTIQYSSAFALTNCNPAANNPNFPANHCWLNPGQYMLILTAGPGGGTNTNVQPIPLLGADLDLGATSGAAATNNSGPVSSTSASNTGYVGHGGSHVLPGASGGLIALVNSVGIGVSCPAGTAPGNPLPASAFSPAAADFLAYFAQASAGGIALNTCWNGSSFPIGVASPGSGAYYPTVMGGAVHVSSSGKNYNALIRSAGNGKLSTGTVITQAAYPAGVILPTTVTITDPCQDTGNNLTDFAAIGNGMGAHAQSNWVLHNSAAYTNPTIEASYASSPMSPLAYTPVACKVSGSSLNPIGPQVSASLSEPQVATGAGNGSVTETLSVTVTPSSKPTSTLFNVHADLSGIAGATSTTPITASSVGVPDGNGNYVYTEQFALPTATAGTYNIPITVMDDAYRPANNANAQTPLIASILVKDDCIAPSGTPQTQQLSWNAPQQVTLGGQVGMHCDASDTLAYAIKTQPRSGTLSAISGNQVTYTPNSGFAGTDSFTFTVTDATYDGGTLVSTPATVNLVVSATGVVPTLTLTCVNVTYDGNAHNCGTALAPFVVGATTVTYAGSPAAPSNAGTYPVQASFVASSGSSQNVTATGSLVINQAAPTFTLTCTTVNYDGNPHGCTATATGLNRTAVNGTTTFTYSGSTTSPSAVGVYPVTASFASSDPNYANASATSTFTIMPVSTTNPTVTLTANDQTMVFGSALPALTYTTNPSAYLPVAPVCTSSVNGSTAVGTYPGAITCSGAVKDGTTIVYVPGNMTITPGAATVTANNQSMTAGSAVPTLTFATNPAGVSFSKAPLCTTTATSASAPGSYPITCSGGVASNYNLTYAGGTLTVSVAPTIPNAMPTLTGISPLRIVGGAPDTTITATGANFVSGAVVQWNGVALATRFVSSSQLTAVIPAASLANAGTVGVSVFNPAPGGGPTSSMAFSVDSASGTAGAFSVSAPVPSITASVGQPAVETLVFTNLLQGNALAVACYNLPAQAACSYLNGQLTISTTSGTPTGTYTVLVVASTSPALTASNKTIGATMLCSLLGFPLALLVLYRGRKSRLFGLGALGLVLMLYVAGCGGSVKIPSYSTSPASQGSVLITLTVK